MALYPFLHASALELHVLSRYPGNRQNDRQTETPTEYAIEACVARYSRHCHSLNLHQI